MVRDRGYEISPEEEPILHMNLNSFVDYINRLAIANQRPATRGLLSRSYTAKLPSGTTKSMLVYYGGKTHPQQKQVSADVVREFIGLVQRYGINEAILIVDAPLSSTGDTELNALTLTKWQVFFDSELTHNPTLHVDNNLHELIPPEETAAKLQELKADLSKLIISRTTDPTIKYYGWVPGNLIRVYRDDRTISILCPKSVNYRVVVG
jgi:DNA-directed RNA polymerase subunit H (RpoH/RPB5)